jgi:hypothetical protein
MSNGIQWRQCFGIILLATLIISCTSTGKPKSDTYFLKHKIDLPHAVFESSAALFYNSYLWTINDNGNEPILYAISTSNGKIEKQVHILNAKNTDWEDLSQDDNSIYIANTGNNSGSRDDLCIYKIAKNLFTAAKEQEIPSQAIDFYYPDQFDFTMNYHNTSYDCEAITCIGDSIFLFTKDWLNNSTTIYALPKSEGNYEARKIIVYPAKGLVTGADYNPTLHTIALVGSDNNTPFVLLLNLNKQLDLHLAKAKKYSLTNEAGIQFEGIAYKGNKLYLTNEASAVPQSIYTFKLN